MANGSPDYGPRRELSQLDPHMPVVSLGDERIYREEHILCYSDEERRLLASMVGTVRIADALGVRSVERKAFWTSWWGRAATVAAVLAAAADLLLAIKSAVS